jgi:GT2 family glycosyltransferase
MNSTAVVVLSKDRPRALARSLSALLSDGRCDVVVVDNASQSETLEALARFEARHPQLRAVRNRVNRGVSGGRNSALSFLAHEFLVFSDDDAVIRAEDVGKVPALFARNPSAGILAFRVRHSSGYIENDHGSVSCQVANFHGAGYAVRRSLFDRVGLLDEECTFGAEELDFSVRALAAGAETIYVPDVEVVHWSHRPARHEGIRRRESWVYNYTRVLTRHFPLPMAIRCSLRLLVSHLFRSVSVSAFGPPLLARAWWRGVLAGRRQHVPVPANVVAAYNNDNLRPDFGNVPLVQKLRVHLRRAFNLLSWFESRA